jgi:hypothetical protein
MDKITENSKGEVEDMSEAIDEDNLYAALNFLTNIAHNDDIKSWIGENLFPTLFKLCVVAYNSEIMYKTLNVFRACSNLHPQNQSRIASHLLEQVKVEYVIICLKY